MAAWAPAITVDRTSDRWQRIRSSCVHAADYVDLDEHTDGVVALLETTRHSTAPRPQDSAQSCAAGAQEER